MSGHNALEEQFQSDFTVTDPGNGGKLACIKDRQMTVLVSAAAETRTIPDPVKAGLEMALTMKTDGGDIVATASTAVNAAGNTVLTFNDAGDTIKLLSIPNGSSGYKWKVIANDGVSLS